MSLKKEFTYQSKKIKEELGLSDLDLVLIQLWIKTSTDETEINLKSSLLEVIEQRADFRANSRVNDFIKKQIWEKGSLNLLEAIVYQTPIKVGYFEDKILYFPEEMLPKFNSFTEIGSSDKRAILAKKLGMKVIAD